MRSLNLCGEQQREQGGCLQQDGHDQVGLGRGDRPYTIAQLYAVHATSIELTPDHITKKYYVHYAGHPGRWPDGGGPRGAGEDADLPAQARHRHRKHRPPHATGNFGWLSDIYYR